MTSCPDSPDLSVVVPAYNESTNAARLAEETAAVLDGSISYEILFVDDGSRDDTKTELQALRENSDLPLRIISHRGNFGQSAAIRTGIRCARSDWIATMDGDGQNDPADIPKLIATRDSSAPEIRFFCGQRMKRQDNLNKRLASRIANAVRSRLLRDATPDTGCGLKLFCRDSYLALPFFNHNHRFLPALARGAGFDVISVPVNHRPRQHGKSKYGTLDRLRAGLLDLLGVMWLNHRAVPTRHDEI